MLIFAHRGLVTDRTPENTIAAAEAALGCQAGGVELDVRQTLDGVPVCCHDPHLGRVAGSPLVVAAARFSELARLRLPGGHRITSLGEALDALAGRTQLILDLKGDGGPPGRLGRAVGSQLRATDSNGIVVSSFDVATLLAVRQVAAGVPIALISRPRQPLQVAFATADAIGAHAVHAHLDALVRDLGTADRVAHRLCPWTVNRPADARRLGPRGDRRDRVDHRQPGGYPRGVRAGGPAGGPGGPPASGQPDRAPAPTPAQPPCRDGVAMTVGGATGRSQTAGDRVLVTAAGPQMRPALHDLALPTFVRFAERWGYCVNVEDLAADGVRADPAAQRAKWAKLGLLREALTRFAVALWVDADVLICRYDEDVASHLPAADFQALGLEQVPHEHRVNPNTGVWLMRSGPAAFAFLDGVLSVGRQPGPWADQGAVLAALGWDRGDERYWGARPGRGSRFLAGTAWLPPAWNQPYVGQRNDQESFNSSGASYVGRPVVADPHALHFMGMAPAARYRSMAGVAHSLTATLPLGSPSPRPCPDRTRS